MKSWGLTWVGVLLLWGCHSAGEDTVPTREDARRFQEVQDQLKALEPKDKGLFSKPLPKSSSQEVRIKLRYDKNKTVSQVAVGVTGGDPLPVGGLVKSSPENNEGVKKKNADVYAVLREKVMRQYEQLKSSGKPLPIVIEAAGDTPYEHVVGVINVCKEAGIADIEFASNPDTTSGKWCRELKKLDKKQ